MFKPGQSGNPAGKPAGLTGHVARCKEWAEKKGWLALEQLAESKDLKIRMEATKLLLAYGVGKPVEHRTVEGTLTLEQILEKSWDEPK